MGKLLGRGVIALGVWLAVMSAIVCWGSTLALVVDEAIAVCIIVLGAVAAFKPSKGLFITIAVAACILVVWGIVGRFVGAQVSVANEILVGLLLFALGIAGPLFLVPAKKAFFYNKQGGELAKCSKVSMKDDDIIAKGVLLGSMPVSIYIKPAELVKVLYLVDPGVIPGGGGSFATQGLQGGHVGYRRGEMKVEGFPSRKEGAAGLTVCRPSSLLRLPICRCCVMACPVSSPSQRRTRRLQLGYAC